MVKIAFVFSGQGAQYAGMGKSLYEGSAAAREVFDTAEKVIPGFGAVCFEGGEKLSFTEYVQPAVYTVDYACAAALAEAGVIPSLTAGFSLGELAANAWAGAFSFEDGLRWVQKRAALMGEAASKIRGAMAAVLKLPDEKSAEIASSLGGVYPANYNAPGQLVFSLPEDKYDKFASLVSAAGGKTVRLAVAGAFHSPYMESAEKAFEAYLSGQVINKKRVPVYSNVTALPCPDGEAEAKALLCAQISNPVRWERTVRNMAADGASVFIEAGPGKVLSGLIKRILPDAPVYYTDNWETLCQTVSAAAEKAAAAGKE